MLEILQVTRALDRAERWGFECLGLLSGGNGFSRMWNGLLPIQKFSRFLREIRHMNRCNAFAQPLPGVLIPHFLSSDPGLERASRYSNAIDLPGHLRPLP